MWTRSLLKKNAWENLKNYYWPALGVSFLSSLLGANSGGGGFGGGGGGGGNSESFKKIFENESGSGYDTEVAIGILIVVVVVFLIALAIGLGLRFFLGNVALCGRCKYFVTARNGDENFNHMFDNFKGGNYKPTVKAMFYWYGEICLWYLLFIIPGVIKAYEYALVPYLIAENPNMDSKRAKEISRQTMDGEKMNFWVLQLSFIGWYMLGYLACCLGVIFVVPYQLATEAEFYMCMRAKMLSLGYTTEEELTGGFFNGIGGGSQYNEPNFNNNAYNVPNNPYDNSGDINNNFNNNNYGNNNSFGNDNFNNSSFGGDSFGNSGRVNLTKPAEPQNPNDIYNGQMPGIDDVPNTPNPYDSNDQNNPYNQ